MMCSVRLYKGSSAYVLPVLDGHLFVLVTGLVHGCLCGTLVGPPLQFLDSREAIKQQRRLLEGMALCLGYKKVDKDTDTDDHSDEYEVILPSQGEERDWVDVLVERLHGCLGDGEQRVSL
jgi:hypothetical protein